MIGLVQFKEQQHQAYAVAWKCTLKIKFQKIDSLNKNRLFGKISPPTNLEVFICKLFFMNKYLFKRCLKESCKLNR